MGLWSIIVPEAGTNLLSNPSFETNTTSWAAANGATLARSSAIGARFGAYSMSITPTVATDDGAYITTPALTSGSLNYTCSLYFQASAVSLSYKLAIGTTAGSLTGEETIFTGTQAWQRVTLQFDGAVAGRRIYIIKNGHNSTAAFYIDGAMCILNSDSTTDAYTYIDGDQEGCLWNGAAHGSTSTRSADAYQGGRVRNFDRYTTYITGMQGVGSAAVQNEIKEYAQLNGGYRGFRRKRVRAFTLGMHINPGSGSTWNAFHLARKNLLSVLDPKIDRPNNNAKVRLQYDGVTSESMRIDADYDSGLEFGTTSGFTEAAPVRFIATQPFFFEDHDTQTVPSVQLSVSNANYILQRDTSGTWSALATGANTDGVYALGYGPDGTLYAGGTFANMDGVANTDGIAKWSGSAWTAMGTGISSGTNQVNAIAFGPDGSVYVGGAFSGMGGVANTSRIARWDGSAWNAMGTGGASGAVLAIAVGRDGTIYAGGTFSGMGGIADTDGIAKWNGSAWSALGTGVSSGSTDVQALTIGIDGALYAGGAFTGMGGVANTSKIAKWDGSAWTALTTGVNDTVLGLTTGADGTIYVGGLFTTAGGLSISYGARWNGNYWLSMGSGTNLYIYEFLPLPNGMILAGGSFTAAGGITLPEGLAVWNGSAWIPTDVNLPSAPNVAALTVNKAGNIVIGYNTGGTATAAAVSTVTNSGTAPAYPILTVTASASNTSQLFQLVNYTTGMGIYFNLTIAKSETVTLDLRPGKKTFTSSFRGNIISAILPGSQFATWALQSGSNSISLFAADSGTTATLVWVEQHLSIDGGAS